MCKNAKVLALIHVWMTRNTLSYLLPAEVNSLCVKCVDAFLREVILF